MKISGVTVIDNYEALVSSKDPDKMVSLYYGDDTHWNKYGAYVAFENVMRLIDPKYISQHYKFYFLTMKMEILYIILRIQEEKF